jgi:peptidoglycan/LPS O-acetylase OafA/YrhL
MRAAFTERPGAVTERRAAFTERSPTRVAALDGLRGIAIALVLVHHSRAVFVPTANETFVPGGFLGVDLFFVLSGFLITSLLVAERDSSGHIRLTAFYRRRLMRLYPALVALLAVHAVYAARIDVPAEHERDAALSILFYYSNWRQSFTIPEGLGHMWSLAVEEQFYLLWPIALLGLLAVTRRRWTVLTGILIAAIAGVALYRAMRWNDGTLWLWRSLQSS